MGKKRFLMSHEWLATSDKWGTLLILSSYPSFNYIPDRKLKTCKEEFLQKLLIKQNYGEKKINHSL